MHDDKDGQKIRFALTMFDHSFHIHTESNQKLQINRVFPFYSRRRKVSIVRAHFIVRIWPIFVKTYLELTIIFSLGSP